MDPRARTAHTSLWWGRQDRPAEPWQAPPGALPEPTRVHDVVVIGAGLTGLATAVMLARGGQPPLVLEARHMAAGTTGHSTAKLSLLQGATYSVISAHADDETLVAYAQAQRAGQSWLLDFCASSGVEVQSRDAWTYAVSTSGAERIEKEAQACLAAGLAVERTTDTELPFEVTAALRLADQAQFDPVEVCQALRDELLALGGLVVERVPVTGLSLGSSGPQHSGSGSAGSSRARRRDQPLTLHTAAGDLRAERVVLATGFPVLDRALYFAQLQPQRSYALAFAVPDPARLPRGMYLSLDDPTRSLRTAPDDGGEMLLVGGDNHVVGRASSPLAAVEDLDTWTRAHFPGAQRVHTWAAQDYRAAGRLPIVGVMPRSDDRVLVATGFDKWGMTNAAAAGLMLANDLLGDPSEALPWARRLRHRTASARDLLSGLGFNAAVGERLTRDWALRALPARSGKAPDEGHGRVERGTLHPTATCTVAGTTYRVEGVCTHLRGILAWNDSDLSWDCPLHGSRFTADGHRIEGPALRDLEPR